MSEYLSTCGKQAWDYIRWHHDDNMRHDSEPNRGGASVWSTLKIVVLSPPLTLPLELSVQNMTKGAVSSIGSVWSVRAGGHWSLGDGALEIWHHQQGVCGEGASKGRGILVRKSNVIQEFAVASMRRHEMCKCNASGFSAHRSTMSTTL